MITEAVTFVSDRLTAAGINATTDPRDLNLPGAWVTPGEFTLSRLQKAAGEVEVIIALVAPDAGGIETLNILDDLLTKAIDAEVGINSIEPGTVQLENHAPGGLPALVATVTISLD